MQPVVVDRQVTASGALNSSFFGMKTESASHIFEILRNSLYSNKELAVLREYAMNAVDAHVEAGRPDQPIKVTLPTVFDPVLAIRDFGNGLSEEDVYEVYAMYGSSTKRNTNAQSGFMGLGSKAAFAYGDSFQLISYYQGVKSIYVASLDETNTGLVTKIWVGPTDEPSGIEVRVDVRAADIEKFEQEARYLFPFLTPPPQLNCNLETKSWRKYPEGWFSRDRNQRGWLAVMGGIPYRLETQKIYDQEDDSEVSQMARRTTGILLFDIGEVSPSTPREEVQYTPQVRAAVKAKFKALHKSVRNQMQETLRDKAATPWQCQVAVANYKEYTHLNPDPVTLKKYPSSLIQLWGDEGAFNRSLIHHQDAPKSFWLGRPESYYPLGESEIAWHTKHQRVCFLDVRCHGTIVVKDTQFPVAQYDLCPKGITFIHPLKAGAKGKTFELSVVMEELQNLLEENQITGIPIQYLSSFPFKGPEPKLVQPTTKVPQPRDIKQKKNYFVWKGTFISTDPGSQAWNVEDRVPSKDDVYINMLRYQNLIDEEWYSKVEKHKKVLAFLGVPFPTIYGVKKGVRNTDEVQGTEYSVWWAQTFKKAVAKKEGLAQDLENYSYQWAFRTNWRACLDQRNTRQNHRSWGSGKESTLSAVLNLLPETSPVHQAYRKADRAHQALARLSKTDREILGIIVEMLGTGKKAHKKYLVPLMARYPLIDVEQEGPGFEILLSKDATLWAQYINQLDELMGKT